MKEEGKESIDRPKPVGCSFPSGKHEGMQLDNLNRIAVITWVKRRGGKAQISRDGVAIWSNRGQRPRHAYIGDWVIRVGDEFIVVPESSDQSIQIHDGPPPRARQARRKLSA